MTKCRKAKLEKNVANFLEVDLKDAKGDVESFINDARRYIKAIKDRRMMCHIVSVAPSGMSRRLKFFELSNRGGVPKTQYQVCNFTCFLNKLGHSIRDNDGSFRVVGCGIDMVFKTNYNIIHHLDNLGFLSSAECEELAQRTPHKI